MTSSSINKTIQRKRLNIAQIYALKVFFLLSLYIFSITIHIMKETHNQYVNLKKKVATNTGT